MISIGITGGIGSGKSVVCRIFSVLGIPVYNADMAAKHLSNTDPEIRNELIAIAGEEVYINGELNRRYLSELIFNNKEMLQKVNRITHPRLEMHYRKWRDHHESFPYTVFESAILIESQLARKFDRIVAVIAPEEIRIARVLSRDNQDPRVIRNIINNQLTEEEFVKKSHHVITNDDQTLVIPQVLKLHQLFLNLK